MSVSHFPISTNMSSFEQMVATEQAYSASNATGFAFTYDSLDVAYEFKRLKTAWHEEYGASSSSTQIVRAPSYRQIVLLGKRVLPYIFYDLRTMPEPDHWFGALREITGENPVPPSHRGDHRAMRKDWLKWADANGYRR